MKVQTKVVFASTVLLLALSLPIQAAFTSRQTATVSASATTSGTGAISFTLNKRSITNPGVDLPATTALSWGSPAGGSNWAISGVLLHLRATVTMAPAGIQIYTDNTNATASPRFEDPTPTVTTNIDSNPAGLVYVPNTTLGERADRTISMAWTIKLTPKTVGSADVTSGLLPADPNEGPLTGADNRFQWLYVTDLRTPAIDNDGDGTPGETANPTATPPQMAETRAFVPGNAFATMISDRGFHYGQADTEFAPPVFNNREAWVYMQGDFRAALPGKTYTTNRLIVEAYTL